MKPVACALGMHKWKVERTSDREAFRYCTRCGKDDAGLPTNFGADNQAWPR